MNSAQARGHDPGRNAALLEQMADVLVYSVAGTLDQGRACVSLGILRDFRQIFIQTPSLRTAKMGLGWIPSALQGTLHQP